MSEPKERTESSVLLWDDLSLRQVDQLICQWVQGWRVFESLKDLYIASSGKPGAYDVSNILYPYASWSPLSDCYYVFHDEGEDAEPYLPSRNANHALGLYGLPLFTNAAFFLNKRGDWCHTKLRTVEKRSFHGNAKTLPLAICHAVLTAYGIVSQTGEVFIP